MSPLHYARGTLVLALMGVSVRGDDWPQWLGPRRDGVWRETGIAFRPKRIWRAAVSQGYSSPVVAGNRVYVTDRVLARGVHNPDDPFKTIPKLGGFERVLCFDAADGKLLWKHEYPCTYEISYAAGPRASPTVAHGKVYALGAMGDLLCLEAERGTVIWSKNLPREYQTPVPLWGFAGHPLVDGDRVICSVGGKGSLLVAFDAITGREQWRSLTAGEPGYSPPTLHTLGGRRVVIQWHPEGVAAVDAETGKAYWSHPFARPRRQTLKAGMAVATPRIDGDRLFLTAFYEGSLMLQLHGLERPTVLWRSQGRSEEPEDSDALHGLMCTPIFKGDRIFGVCAYGELRCLDAGTGRRLWQTHQATGGKSLRWANAYLVAHEDRFLLFNELGDLILAKLDARGYEEIGRANVIRPTNTMADPAGRRVVWAHPAFARRCVFVRNDEELVCVSLAAE